jgi:drug/metabolite transporter (DMT)-like permease
VTPEPADGAPSPFSRALPYAAVAAAAASWGTWGLIIRRAQAIGPVPAALESSIVMAVVAIVCGLVALGERRPTRASPEEGGRKVRTWKDWSLVAWFGVGDVLNVLLFFAAYKLTIAVAVLTHYMTPILVALTAPLVLKERMTGRTGLAIAVSCTGLVVMLAPSGAPSAAGADPSLVWTSAALGVSSAVFYASNVLVNKFIADAFTAAEAMFWHGVVATGFGLALVPRGAWASVDAGAAAFIAVAAIGPGALGGLAFVWGLRRMPAAHASTMTLLEPMVSVLLGAAVLAERVAPRAVAGGALILAGAAVVMTQKAPARAAAARVEAG